jgi:hypothetical protein
MAWALTEEGVDPETGAALRRVVQIQDCWVLCDDGTIWQTGGDGWTPVELPPGCAPKPAK